MHNRCRWHSECDGRHCHPKKPGDLVELRFDAGVFRLQYKSSQSGHVVLRLFDSEHYYDIALFGISFCLTCGAYIAFLSKYGICWRCKDELEDSEGEDSV